MASSEEEKRRFIEELKRAILLEGRYVTQLGPEVLDCIPPTPMLSLLLLILIALLLMLLRGARCSTHRGMQQQATSVHAF